MGWPPTLQFLVASQQGMSWNDPEGKQYKWFPLRKSPKSRFILKYKNKNRLPPLVIPMAPAKGSALGFQWPRAPPHARPQQLGARPQQRRRAERLRASEITSPGGAEGGGGGQGGGGLKQKSGETRETAKKELNLCVCVCVLLRKKNKQTKKEAKKQR